MNDHPSHTFPDHGPLLATVEVRDGQEHCKPADLRARLERDRTAVWRCHERKATGRIRTLSPSGEWRDIDDGVVVEFELVDDAMEFADDEFHCPLCGVSFPYRRAKD